MSEKVTDYELEVLRALRFLQLYDDAEKEADRRPITLDMLRERIGHTTEFPTSKKEYARAQAAFGKAALTWFHRLRNNDFRVVSALNSLQEKGLARSYSPPNQSSVCYTLTMRGTTFITGECLDLRYANHDFLFS